MYRLNLHANVRGVDLELLSGKSSSKLVEASITKLWPTLTVCVDPPSMIARMDDATTVTDTRVETHIDDTEDASFTRAVIT